MRTAIATNVKLSMAVRDACDRHRIKMADLQGGEDVPFEQAFANLAHAYIADRAPGLLDYEVGFQLLDRNDDGDRAVGVIGFKVGSQWLYAPVFFVNGDLKGHELLYVKGQNCFVPMGEDWANYLINKRPLALGTGSTRDTRSMGASHPDYSRMLRPPGKYASADDDGEGWRLDARRWYAHRFRLDPFGDHYAGLPTVPDQVRRLGVKAAAALLAYVESYPQIGRVLDEAYGDEIVKAAADARDAELAKRASAPARSLLGRPGAVRGLRPRDLDPIKRGALGKVEWDADHPESKLSLPEDERALAVGDGPKIRDNREDGEYTKVRRIDSPRQLQSPDASGLYDVATADDKVVKCVVIVGPHGPEGRPSLALVIEAESPHRWFMAHPTQVATTGQHDDAAWRSWAGGLSGLDSFPTTNLDTPLAVGEGQSPVVAIDADRADGSLPFTVENDSYPEGRYEFRRADFSENALEPTPVGLGSRRRSHRYDANYGIPSSGHRRVAIGPEGIAVRSDGRTLYLPSNWKKLTLGKGSFWCGESRDRLAVGEAAFTPTLLGTKEAGAFDHRLRVEDDLAGGYLVDDRRASPERALDTLVFRHGLSVPDAQSILKQADAAAGTHRPRVEVDLAYPAWVKAAARGDYGGAGLPTDTPMEPPLPSYLPYPDSFMGTGHPTYESQYDHAVVPGLMANPSAIETYRPNGPIRPDPVAAQTAQRAAETGQREIFDTSMLGALLTSSQGEDLVSRDLADLTKGMDRCGQVLFKLYAHTEKFEDRYGKDSLPELEDTLRDCFRKLGDLILYLRKKTIEPDPRERLEEISLDRGKE